MHGRDVARQLWKDIVLLQSKAIRLIFEMFAKDRYSPSSLGGRKLLMGHLVTLPDNKSVEDVHQPLRLDSKANMNRKLRANRIDSIIENSGVLEKRGVRNPAKVDKETFCRQFRTKRSMPLSHIHDCKSHKLPKHWSRTLHPNKAWCSLSEAVTQRNSAAWMWLHTYMRLRGQQEHVRLSSATFSKLLLPCTLVLRTTDDTAFASLGNAVWAALGWPMERVAPSSYSSLAEALSLGSTSRTHPSGE